MNVIAWGAPQWIIAAYFFSLSIFPLSVRAFMMANGGRNFVPWGEYLKTWAVPQIVHSVVVGVVLYFGGFWN